MGRKREKPYFPHNDSSSLSKRLRSMPSVSEDPDLSELNEHSNKSTRNRNSTMVVVTGLSHGCSVLNLKTRFEMYGSISRIRIDHGVGYITYRSNDSAEAAIAAALDPFLEVTVDSQKVEVSWPSDRLPGWREGVGISGKISPTSKLLRPEVPLRKHGRDNKLDRSTKNLRNLAFLGREIIAYDDLL